MSKESELLESVLKEVSDYNKADKSLEDITASIVMKEKAIEDLNKKLKEQRAELKQLHSNSKEMQAELDAMPNKALEKAKAEVESFKDKSAAEIKNLQGLKSSEEGKIAKLRAEVRGLKDDIAKANETLQEIESKTQAAREALDKIVNG